MAESNHPSDDQQASTSAPVAAPPEYVERSDVGVSITVELKRGTGTRDQDKLIAKAKGRTLNDARADMNELREYLHDLADDARAIQADPEPTEMDE